MKVAHPSLVNVLALAQAIADRELSQESDLAVFSSGLEPTPLGSTVGREGSERDTIMTDGERHP